MKFLGLYLDRELAYLLIGILVNFYFSLRAFQKKWDKEKRREVIPRPILLRNVGFIVGIAILGIWTSQPSEDETLKEIVRVYELRILDQLVDSLERLNSGESTPENEQINLKGVVSAELADAMRLQNSFRESDEADDLVKNLKDLQKTILDWTEEKPLEGVLENARKKFGGFEKELQK